ncbi:unnamed protein product [Globisporangium polare]
MEDRNSEWQTTIIALSVFFFLLAVYATCNTRKCRAATEKRNAVDPEATIACEFEPMTGNKKRGFVAAFWRVCAAVQIQGSNASAVSAPY